MTKIYNSELSSANSSNMIKELEKEIETSTKLISIMSEFLTSSTTVLVGGGYDAVRAKLSLYSDALSKQITICQNLANNLKAANNIMINYMEGYEMLDDAYIGDIKNSISDIKAFLDWLKSYTTITRTDSQGNTTTESVRNGTDAEIESWTGILHEFEHLLELLENLKPTDESAFSLLDSVKTDVISFGKALQELKLPDFNGKIEDDSDSLLKGLDISFENKYGNYTEDQLKNMSEQEVRNMSREEFIDFIGSLAQLVYQEQGGILPSVTIAQACLESGYGDSFIDTTNNVFGLRGYPAENDVVHGSNNYLKQFNSFYEATVAHAEYFKYYNERKGYYASCLNYCEQGDGLAAAGCIDGYCGAGYSSKVQAIIQMYDLTRYDNVQNI